MDRIDRGRLLIAALSLIALIAAVVVLSQADYVSKPMAINGDQVGQHSEESLADYQSRALESVEAADSPAFALVTFRHSLDPDAAGRLLEKAKMNRVNAALSNTGLPIDLPEPIAGSSRGQTLREQLTLHQLPPELRAVVVYDNGEQLRALAQVPEVFTVEVLPADAAWGRFGIRPVQLENQ